MECLEYDFSEICPQPRGAYTSINAFWVSDNSMYIDGHNCCFQMFDPTMCLYFQDWDYQIYRADFTYGDIQGNTFESGIGNTPHRSGPIVDICDVDAVALLQFEDWKAYIGENRKGWEAIQRQFFRKIRRHVPASTVLIRFRMDMYMFILPKITEADFMLCMESARQTVTDMRFAGRPGFRLRASIGGMWGKDDTYLTKEQVIRLVEAGKTVKSTGYINGSRAQLSRALAFGSAVVINNRLLISESRERMLDEEGYSPFSQQQYSYLTADSLMIPPDAEKVKAVDLTTVPYFTYGREKQ